MSKLKVVGIKKIEKLQYLHAFEIDYLTKSGKAAKWELVSRQGIERIKSEINEGKRFSDGVMIFAVDEMRTQVAMLKEFRVSLGGYVYMFPAGLSDADEEMSKAAAREFKEETGMTFDCEYISKARFVSLGIVNEAVNVAYGYYHGEPTNAYQDDKEDAEIVFVNRDFAKKILENEDVPFRSAQLLEHFFRLNPFFDR